MFTVALTGGIASGKSTVASYFAELGVAVIDADQIARKLIDNPEVLHQVVEYFGQAILMKDQQLDRTQLRIRIFSNTEDRNYLEQLLHPLIYKEIHSSIQIVRSAYCLIVIPLLFEERTATLLKKKSDFSEIIKLNRVLLVATSKVLQIKRAKERDHLKKTQIDAILSVQKPAAENLHRADDIIYNQTTLADLRQSVERFHHMYLSFSQSKNFILEQSAFLSYYLIPK
ncbi:MAG: dephospho-CoA kinase [Rickettsiella sp.]|nr:dephospho-CoA kinase [Rickettsiella sp.]